MLFTYEPHSIVNLITNSSSELFISDKAMSLGMVEKILKEIHREAYMRGKLVADVKAGDSIDIAEYPNLYNIPTELKEVEEYLQYEDGQFGFDDTDDLDVYYGRSRTHGADEDADLSDICYLFGLNQPVIFNKNDADHVADLARTLNYYAPGRVENMANGTVLLDSVDDNSVPYIIMNALEKFFSRYHLG